MNAPEHMLHIAERQPLQTTQHIPLQQKWPEKRVLNYNENTVLANRKMRNSTGEEHADPEVRGAAFAV